MPELKRTFTAGKMNRDLDDRLLPNGEYRDALNVNIGKSEGSDIGAVENLFGNEAETALGLVGAITIGTYRDNGGDRLYFFSTSNNSTDFVNEGEHYIHEYEQRTGNVNLLATGDWLDFHQESQITGINFIDSLLYWTDDRSQPRKINVDRARADSTYYDSDSLAAVAKFAPFTAPIVESITTSINDDTITSNFLQDKLPRFAYRFQFDDGEYSTISPFTPICFSPPSIGAADETTRALLTVDTIRSGELSGLINDIKSVNLGITVPLGLGITDVELLYKETTNANLYVVDEQIFDEAQEDITFVYKSQDPFRTIANDQLTRVYDAVPRLAKSQEIAGSRIVYGNYLQNRNIPNLSFSVEAVSTGELGHPIFRNYSVKSRRTYQVGIILSDEYGRQSPIILSSSGNDTVFVDAIAQSENEIRQKLQITFETQPPSWAHSYRIAVKQREQEYYNVFSQAGATTIDEFNYNTIGRFGDSINKIPIDQTIQTEAGGLIAPTSISVYPKIAPGENIETSGLIKVQGINNSGGQAIIPGATGTGSVVYETEPIISDIDIFFETSTGGLVSNIVLVNAVDIAFWNCSLVDLFLTTLETSELGTIEVNRLRAGYNEPFFDIGVRAYQVQENFAEERRSNALIHSSGFFNSRTSLNELNQFNEAEGGLTISLDPADGSIQKIFAEDTQLIIWQEDKVSRSPIDKDFIYSAEGGAVPVTSNSQYLGTIAPYAGEYGISKDPSSFAVYGMNKFFTDRNRGVVLRLGQNGLTEISRSGMVDFFRDALFGANRVIGSYDEYQNSYNLTIIGQGYTTQLDTNIATAGDGYFTVGWEENAQGWVSFKTFQQEGGTTLNNRYYTFKGAEVWQHNSPTVPRNTFYKTQTEIDAPGFIADPSYIDLIFNDSPSLIKEFLTLSLEGSTGWECESIETDIESVGDLVPIDDSVSITVTNENTLTNTILSGVRTQIGIPAPNAVLRWTILASASDASRIFDNGDQALIVDPEIAGLTITGGTPIVDMGVTTIPGIVTLGRGTLSWDIEYDIQDVTEDLVIRLTFQGNGPIPITSGHLVILNIAGVIPNMSFTPNPVLLSDTDFAGNDLLINPLTFTANADTNTADITLPSYFFAFQTGDDTLPIADSGSNAELTIDYSRLDNLIPGDPNEITYRLDPANLDNLQTTFTLMRPALEVFPVITLTGDGPSEFPIVTWNLLDLFQENIIVRETFTYPGVTPLILPDHPLGGPGQDQTTLIYVSPRERATNVLVFEPITTHTFVEGRGTFNIIATPNAVFGPDNVAEAFPADGTWEVTLTPEQILEDVSINYDIGGAAVPVDFVNGASVLLPFAVASTAEIPFTANVRSDAFIGSIQTSAPTDSKPTEVILIGGDGDNGEASVARSTELVPTVNAVISLTTFNQEVDAGNNPISRSFFVRAQRTDFSAPVPNYLSGGNVLFMQVTQPALSQTLTYTNPRGGTASNYETDIDLTTTDATDVDTQVVRWQNIGGVPTESVGFGRTNSNFLPNFNLAGGTITFNIASTYEWRATLTYSGDTTVLIENTGADYDNRFLNDGYTGNHLELEHGTSGRIQTFDSTVAAPITTFQLHCRNVSNVGPGDGGGDGNSDFVNMALLTIQSLGGLNSDNRRVGSLFLYINQQAIP